MNAAPQSAEFRHGNKRINDFRIDCYSLALRDGEGFVGDRARSKAFQEILDHQRREHREAGSDPLGPVPSSDHQALDEILNNKEDEAASVVRAAIETFAGELADVVRHFLKAGGWQGTQRIAVGGGLRENDVGEVAIRRASTMLNADGHDVELRPIHNDADEAALIGAAHLCPAALLKRHQAILAVDIGGGSIRAGVVLLNYDKAPDLAQAEVWMLERWKHSDDQPSRDEAVGRLCDMLAELKANAEAARIDLAPFIGLACPGEIRGDGTISRGTQNLPGDWEAADFNLPARIRSCLPIIAGSETLVVLHNDAVLQGLSEVPRMRGIWHWGILTVGTGLGNARFTTDP